MKNLYFLQIQNLIDGYYFLPTASGYLYSYCFKNKKILDHYSYAGTLFLRQDVEKVLSELKKPDVLCISTYVWNFEYSKKFARAVKEQWPDSLIIMGGPHVPYRLDFQKELPYVDLVVMHEGEQTLEEILLSYIDDNCDFKNIPGVISRNSTSLIRRERIKEIDKLTSPCLNGFYDSILEGNPGLSFSLVIETNRGCPYSCSFCDMQDRFYQKITKFPIDVTFQELEWASQKKISYVDCADSNFGILDRDIEIALKIVSLKKQNGYPRFFNYTSAKNQPENVNQVQRILSEVGIDRGISISLQSFDLNVQKIIRRYNQPTDELKRKIEYFAKEGLESFVEIILGLPGESKETWIKGIVDLLELNYTGALLVHPLSIVPNTPFTDESYVESFDLVLTTTRSPAQGFNYGFESEEEREVLCVGSTTMTTDDWIDCYIYSKCYVGAGFFHGLAAFLSRYLKKEKGLPVGEFFFALLNYSKNSKSYLNKFYNKTRADLFDSLFNLRPFGRKVLDDDFYWSDQAAAAIEMLRDFDELYNDIWHFCLSEGYFENDEQELYDSLKNFSLNSLENPYAESGNSKTYIYNWYSYFFEDMSLECSPQEINFTGKDWKSPRDHALHIYWYGRKSRRCFKSIERC
jgi:radical SAM superfamily enzyme YgiQ (UPF0313 family)